MTTLSDRLSQAFLALQSATVRNDQHCLPIISAEIQRLVNEVKELEEKPEPKQTE